MNRTGFQAMQPRKRCEILETKWSMSRAHDVCRIFLNITHYNIHSIESATNWDMRGLLIEGPNQLLYSMSDSLGQ